MWSIKMKDKPGTELLRFEQPGILWRLSLDYNGDPHLEYESRDVIGNLCWKEMSANDLALRHPPFWLDLLKTVYFQMCRNEPSIA